MTLRGNPLVSQAIGQSSPEYLIVRSRALQNCDPIAHGPHQEPVAHVTHMAFTRTGPFAREPVHVVPTLQLLARGKVVPGDQLKDRMQWLNVLVLGHRLVVALES